MSNEYEYRFLFDDINITQKDIRERIRKIGGEVTQKKTITPIITYIHPLKKDDIYIRVRDEGNNVKTFTIKTNLGDKFQKEYQINIDDIKMLNEMLLLLGCETNYYIEKIRETWHIKNNNYGIHEIVFDSYPALPTYMEIEAESKDKLDTFCALLGIDITKHYQGDLYNRYYGLPKDRKMNNELTFNNVNKLYRNMIIKNHELFDLTLKLQQDYINERLK